MTLPFTSRVISIALAVCVGLSVLLLGRPLIGALQQNLGYVHLTRALVSGQSAQGELSAAQDLFAQAMRWQEGNARVRWGLGLVYHQVGDDAAAVEEWRSTADALPRLVARSEVAAEKGDHAQALEYALLALQIDPNSSSAHYRLAEAYRGLEDLDAAVSEYETAKTLNSFLPGDEADLASCYFGLAKVYQARENWQAARWQYEVGLQLRRDAPAYAAVASIYQYKVRDLQVAESYLRQAIAMEPDEPWYRVDLAEVHLGQERYQDALSQLKMALSLGRGVAETAPVHVLLGRAYYGLEEFDAAAQAYDAALALDPDNEAARDGLEQALAKTAP